MTAWRYSFQTRKKKQNEVNSSSVTILTSKMTGSSVEVNEKLTSRGWKQRLHLKYENEIVHRQ